MAAHLISPWLPDLKVPRWWPCMAQPGGGGPVCGITPASRWRRWCFAGHERDCWLCGVHAKMAAAGFASCDDCAGRGLAAPAWVTPVDLIMLGHPWLSR